MLGEKLNPAEGNPTPNSVCSMPGVSSPDKIMSLLSQSLSETTQYWHCVSFARVCFHLCPQEITLEAFPFRGCHQIRENGIKFGLMSVWNHRLILVGRNI